MPRYRVACTGWLCASTRTWASTNSTVVEAIAFPMELFALQSEVVWIGISPAACFPPWPTARARINVFGNRLS